MFIWPKGVVFGVSENAQKSYFVMGNGGGVTPKSSVGLQTWNELYPFFKVLKKLFKWLVRITLPNMQCCKKKASGVWNELKCNSCTPKHQMFHKKCTMRWEFEVLTMLGVF